MNLDAFSLRDIQMFLALAQVAEEEGVTDLRFVRQRLQEYVNGSARQQRVVTAPGRKLSKRAATVTKHPSCPACGKPTKIIAVGVERVMSCTCPSCSWSKYLGDK